MTEVQFVGLAVSAVTALVSLWTRVTVAELKAMFTEKFATKDQFARLEERVLDLERHPVRQLNAR